MPRNKKQKKLNSYLEIYIKEDGSLILSPLTDNTAAVLREISKDSKFPKGQVNTYCG